MEDLNPAAGTSRLGQNPKNVHSANLQTWMTHDALLFKEDGNDGGVIFGKKGPFSHFSASAWRYTAAL